MVVVCLTRCKQCNKCSQLNDGRVCCLCTVGQLVDSLPEGEPVRGVTLLAGELYLLRRKERDHVEVYDVSSYRLLRSLTVPGIHRLTDMTSCEHNHCVYIGDYSGDDFSGCVCRLNVRGTIIRWAVNGKPCGLSVNTAHNVIVVCVHVRKIKEFSTYGDLLRELTLPDDIINPWHAIQTRSGQFIVCHGELGDAVHRVCMMSADGCHIDHSHGRQPGSETGQCNRPRHLAVDDSEFVFVVDLNNRRVTLLSLTLQYLGQVVSRNQLKWGPWRLCLDTDRRLLYVADNEWKDDKWTAGRVVVFRV